MVQVGQVLVRAVPIVVAAAMRVHEGLARVRVPVMCREHEVDPRRDEGNRGELRPRNALVKECPREDDAREWRCGTRRPSGSPVPEWGTTGLSSVTWPAESSSVVSALSTIPSARRMAHPPVSRIGRQSPHRQRSGTW